MADQTQVGARDRGGADPAGAGRSGNGRSRPSARSDASPSTERRRDTSDEPTGAVPTVAPDDAEWTKPGEASDSDQPTRPRVGSASTRSDQDRSVSSTVSESLRRLTRPRGQLRARKVHRIVRRIDPWSILKVSLVFYFCVWIMVLVAMILMWGVAVGSGTVASLESFIAEFLAFEEFRFNGDQLFQLFALGGLIGVFVATAVTAVLAVLFNLIADLTGGIRMTVIEEESARRVIPRDEQASPTQPH